MIGSPAVDPPVRDYARFGVHNARRAFRLWRRSRPFWAAVIALVGGLPMWYFPSKAVQFLFVTQTPIWAGILVGVLVEFFAVMLLVQPQFRTMYGMFVVLLSLLSFITSDFGGLFIGMLLGILGGSLALAWTPVMGKTKRQRKWLAKSGVIVTAPAHETIVLDEPAPIVLEQPGVIDLEPVPLTEAQAASAPDITIIADESAAIDVARAETAGSDEIDITAWEMPPESGSEAIDLDLNQPVQPHPSEIDVRDVLIDLREASSTVDLSDEKATTGPPEVNPEEPEHPTE